MGDVIESGVRSIPKYGDQIADSLKYSTLAQAKIEKTKDLVEEVGGRAGYVMTSERGEDVVKDIGTLLKSGTNFSEEIAKRVNSIANAGVVGETTRVADTLENAQKLLKWAGEDASLKNLMQYDPEDLVKAYKTLKPGETGVEFYDNWINKMRNKGPVTGEILDTIKAGTLAKSMRIYDKVKDFTPFDLIISANDTLISLFKIFKVPASVSAHVYAWSGNLTMGWMLGLPIGDREYLMNIYKANKFLRGKQDALWLRNNLFNEINDIVDFAEKHPNQFQQAHGFSKEDIISKITAENKIVGDLTTDVYSRIKTELKSEWDKLDIDPLVKLEQTLVELEQKLNKTPEDIAVLREIKAASQEIKLASKGANRIPSSIQTGQKVIKDAEGASYLAVKSPSGFGFETLNSPKVNQWKINIEKKAKAATSLSEKAYYNTMNLIIISFF